MAKSKYNYSVPYPKGVPVKAVSDPRAHKGKLKHAIDFVMPEGAAVLAARDGTVVKIEHKFTEGRNDPTLANKANFITIHHGENEFSQYVHLKHEGVLVKKGQKVKKGWAIGLSGNTGYSAEPHLHFVVFQTYGSGEDDWNSVEINFE